MIDDSEYIYGLRPIVEAIEAGREIDKVLLRNDLHGDLAKELFDAIHLHKIPTQRVPPEKLDRITRRNHQGAIAILAAVDYADLRELVPRLYEEGFSPFIVLLDGITDVRNFGAIARTAECGGVDAIVIPSRGGVSVTADAVKTSAGALNFLPVCREKSLVNAVKFLLDNGYNVVAATEKSQEDYTSVNYDGPTAIVMGNEYEGISDDILRLCTQKVSIPQIGHISSLNVSAATAVMIYEVVRQRLKSGFLRE